jgi:hypothetical protein
MDNFFFEKVMPLFFVFMFSLIIAFFGWTGFLEYECYTSGNPSSVECFMSRGNQQTINLNEKVR